MTRAARFIPRDYEVFAGLDVDKRSTSVVFTDHNGTMRALRMAGQARPLVNYVRKHFVGQRVAFAYEAGPTGFGLHDELVSEAYTCLVVAPSKVPRARGERVKTNRLDSRKLAENLRGGQLQSAGKATRRRRFGCRPRVPDAKAPLQPESKAVSCCACHRTPNETVTTY